MNTPEKILSTLRADRFVGRGRELARLIAHSSDGGILDVHAAPDSGASEMLRQVYDHFFRTASETVPFYFRIRNAESTDDAGRRWVREFITQTAAFDRRVPELIAAKPEIHELIDFVSEHQRSWIESAAGLLRRDAPLESLLAVPFRAAANGVRSFILVDEFERSSDELADAMRRVLADVSLASVLCFARRHQPKTPPFARLHLDRLAAEDAKELLADHARERHISLSEEVCDLAVLLLASRPVLLRAIVDAAAARDASLSAFSDLARVYTDELFGISIGRKIDHELDRLAGDPELEKEIFRQLSATQESGSSFEVEWQTRLGLSAAECGEMLSQLHEKEFISRAAGRVYFPQNDEVFADYVRARAELETSGKTRARVVAETLTANLARGPRLLARRYRREATVGLRELLASFAGQSAALASIDFRKFEAELKGRSDDEQLAKIAATPERILLPQIFFSVNAADIYPSIGRVADVERTAIGFGVSDDGDETAWLAAEFDSKLAASLDLTEYWLDRLEMAALASELKKYRLWLVTSEGFDEAASQAIAERGAFGSSYRQIELLRIELGLADSRPHQSLGQFEITIPMGGDTEIVAARFAEEIAERQDFSPRDINQIKTALVEACINASEHSLSPERKIHLTFTPFSDRLEIVVRNRGLRLKDKLALGRSEKDGQRRGWGLELMAKLVDSVEILPTDDGTAIRITKLLSHR